MDTNTIPVDGEPPSEFVVTGFRVNGKFLAIDPPIHVKAGDSIEFPPIETISPTGRIELIWRQQQL